MIKSAAILFGVVVALVAVLLSVGVLLSGGDSQQTEPISVTQTELEPPTLLTETPTPLVPTIPPQGGTAVSIPDIYDAAVVSVVSVSTEQGDGSGWVWSADGYIVTNYHVVQCDTCSDSVAEQITVAFFDGLEYAAEPVAYDSASDLAVLRVTGRTDLVPLPRGNSEQITVGQTVFAVGSPFGQDFSITSGIISALGRDINSGFSNYSISGVIQTDTALNPGNSGGPLIDTNGRIIGINTQISSTTGANSGIGYAVPINIALRVVPSLISDGEYQHAWLGVSGQSVDLAVREAANLAPAVQGFIIGEVTPDSPAALAGLQGSTINNGVSEYDGDIIIGINGGGSRQFFPVTDFEALISFLTLYTSPEDTISLLVLRDGEQIIVMPTLKTRP